jgi:hypothetical protein
MGKPICCHISDLNVFVHAIGENFAILTVLLKEMDQNVLFSAVSMVIAGW